MANSTSNGVLNFCQIGITPNDVLYDAEKKAGPVFARIPFPMWYLLRMTITQIPVKNWQEEWERIMWFLKGGSSQIWKQIITEIGIASLQPVTIVLTDTVGATLKIAADSFESQLLHTSGEGPQSLYSFDLLATVM